MTTYTGVMVFLVIGRSNSHKEEYVDAVFRDRSDAKVHKELCESVTTSHEYRVDERCLR